VAQLAKIRLAMIEFYRIPTEASEIVTEVHLTVIQISVIQDRVIETEAWGIFP
jgi:hypothetical protein